MSSLKAAVKGHQKTHRERGQLSNRKHLGLLEKHKDYVLRAKNFHKKENFIKKLKKKTLEKNPDEFYFQMVNTKTKDGVHIKPKDHTVYTKDQMDLMKTQDLNYLTMQNSKEKKKIEKLQCNLHNLKDVAISGSTHTIFVDSKEDEGEIEPSTLSSPIGSSTVPKKVAKLQKRSYEELKSRKDRLNNINKARSGLILQRNLMGKGTVTKRKNNGEVVYKWKKIRKR